MAFMEFLKFWLYFWIIWTLINLSSTLQEYWCTLSSFLMLLPLAYFTRSLQKQIFNSEISSNGKAVLITGCGSGFGLKLAKKLHAKGFYVFASCHSPNGQGPDSLKLLCSNRMHVFGLDITKEEDVQQAVNYVQKNLNGLELWALVNNAGIYKGYGIDFTNAEVFEEVMKVNVIGTVRVTKAFLPLLKTSAGRVITVTSTSARTTSPYMATYAMAKHALSSFSDCLRQEMHPWKIKVVTIEPEMFKTPINDPKRHRKEMDKLFQTLDQNIKEAYGLNYFKSFGNYIEYILNLSSDRVNTVIDMLEMAVCIQEPKYAYKPRRNILNQFGIFMWENAPQPIIDEIIRIFLYFTRFPKPQEFS